MEQLEGASGYCQVRLHNGDQGGQGAEKMFGMMGLLRQRGGDEEVSSAVLLVQGRRRRDLPRGHETSELAEES